MGYKTSNQDIPGRAQQGGKGGINSIAGVYVAIVLDNTDSIYTGRIKVKIPEFGATAATGSRDILLVTPYGGISNTFNTNTDVKNDAQAPRSYGMWPQPPEVGTEVLVAFTTSREQGFLLGSTISKDRNQMMGGQASSNVYDSASGKTTFGPSTEQVGADKDSQTRPTDSMAQSYLQQQGLAGDFVRGHSASSARRESPSKVFGINTLGGHVLTMDDGDAQGASKNIRIRTRAGAQILMDDSNDFIFVINSQGSAWVEIDSGGNVDVFSEKNISMHSQQDFNVHAKGSINMEAEQGVNIRSTGSEGIKLQSTVGSIDVHSALDTNITAGGNSNILSSHHKETAGRIDMNGPQATEAAQVETNALVSNTNVLTSASTRVPERHPWKGVSGVQESFTDGKGNIN